jgi:hypothetical protein
MVNTNKSRTQYEGALDNIINLSLSMYTHIFVKSSAHSRLLCRLAQYVHANEGDMIHKKKSSLLDLRFNVM